jgi:glyoxylase-like metal-dependent hydrolase (beta-lactamase superfamily II)
VEREVDEMKNDITAVSERLDRTVHCISVPTGLPVGAVNAYLIKQDGQAVLLDCGPNRKESETALIQGLRTQGVYHYGDLSALILTHGHVDHVGLAGKIQSEGVPVYSHPDVAYWVDAALQGDRYRMDFYQALYILCDMPEHLQQKAMSEFLFLQQLNDQSVVNGSLIDGDRPDCSPTMNVVEVPGHAQAAIGLWEEATGTFFGGDQLIGRISSNALVEPELGAASGAQAKRTRSLLDYRNNLRRLLELPINVVLAGHGSPVEHPHDLIKQRLLDQERRRDKVWELVRTSPGESAWFYTAQYFPHRMDQPSLILSEILGFLDWLEADGAICSKTVDGVLRFFIE